MSPCKDNENFYWQVKYRDNKSEDNILIEHSASSGIEVVLVRYTLHP